MSVQMVIARKLVALFFMACAFASAYLLWISVLRGFEIADKFSRAVSIPAGIAL